ncbi:xanthine dehydrogenase [bacterium LRH843]|nr:xanthine dehydrogenase [bacterium LRH843]
MIPFDFEYYRPVSMQVAIQMYDELNEQGKKVIYYSGGTEFITFARLNQMSTEAVIDIKGIPDCHVLESKGDQLVIGSAVSLNMITNSGLFPLLGETVKNIADHTSRNKITLGGNIMSQLIYRESVLPLLVADAKVRLFGNEGDEIVPLADIFRERLNLNPNQFLVQIIVDKDYVSLPFSSIKKTKMTKVGYPVVSVAALVMDSKIRAAFSGINEYPFRSTEIEKVLNDSSLTEKERADQAVKYLPSPVIEDIQASAEYREFVFCNVIEETIKALEAK